LRAKFTRLLWLVPVIAVIPILYISYLDNKDRPCGRIETLYQGSFSSYETYQIRVDGRMYRVTPELWNTLNVGDLYCEE
jgi:hypothetical protein